MNNIFILTLISSLTLYSISLATQPKTTIATKTETKPTGAKVTTTTKKTTKVTQGLHVTETQVTTKEKGVEGKETTTQHTHVSAIVTKQASPKLQENVKKLGAIFGGK